MAIEFEGPQLFAASPFGEDGRGHLRLILVDRVEAWLRAYSSTIGEEPPALLIDRIAARCAIDPLVLDQSSAVDWSVAAATDRDNEPRVRIEKSIRHSGNEMLFSLAPRTPLPTAPRAVVTPTTLRFVATAPWDSFDLVRQAIDDAELRVRQFLSWQHLDVADINRELADIAAERLCVRRQHAIPAHIAAARQHIPTAMDTRH